MSSPSPAQPLQQTKPAQAAPMMAYSKPQHAHPTAYYVFDMLFKLVMSGALIGIVAILAVGVADAKSKNTEAISRLATIGSNIGQVATYLSRIETEVTGIDTSLSRIENDLSR